MGTQETKTINASDSKGYKIIFEKEKALEILHSIFCNGALSCFSDYGFVLDWVSSEYGKAKKDLGHEGVGFGGVCYEDILVQIVRNGGELIFIDEECEGDNTKKLNLGVLIDGLNNASLDKVFEIINGEDDATTGELVLQEILFGEVIFG